MMSTMSAKVALDKSKLCALEKYWHKKSFLPALLVSWCRRRATSSPSFHYSCLACHPPCCVVRQLVAECFNIFELHLIRRPREACKQSHTLPPEQEQEEENGEKEALKNLM